MPSAADALFLPAAERVFVALAGALVAIVAAERKHLRELGGRVLFVRWRTWAITAPIFGFAAMGPAGAAVGLVAALSLQGMREYAALIGLPKPYRIALYVAGVASVPVAATNLTLWRAMPPILLIGATLAPLAMQDVKEGVRHLAFAALGFAYVPWLLTYFLLVRQHVDGGRGILLAIGTAVAMSDVAAFCSGRVVGRHRLAAQLSPAKTWEGVAGNLAGAYAGFALMGFALPAGLNPVVRWTLPAVVAAGCVWGDLVESLIKRHAGVKDAGSWLPGFGGLLDRIDSLLVVLPLAYTVLVVWG
ncbi:MAG: phosphatidate cytidylyltransferase [Actinobacteria bacterium]|nr:MAG: phosphatidate cytidylyltransferase [Actinomycetota bacterium]